MTDSHTDVAAAARRPRPVLHFTPATGWMNDPNGLVVADGVYHLCYQHNPDAPSWGNLHWGHAVSTDLVRWEHRDVAIAPDAVGQAFSGSAVVDVDDSAGFGAGALVAIYTQHLRGLQRQSIAVSTDGGDTWKPHADNPVIENPGGTPDFRDPTVLATGADGDDRWMMVLAVGPDLWVYRSADLQRWEQTSTVPVRSPWQGSTAEVPELIRVPIEGTSEHVSVLIVSWIPGDDADGSARVRWCLADVEGTTVEPLGSAAMGPLDHGREFYAPMAWDRGPDRPPVIIGWLDERTLDDADGQPTAPWCGRMSVPREVTAIATDEGLRLRQRPIVADPDGEPLALPTDGPTTRIDATTWTLSLTAVCETSESAVDVTIGSGDRRETISLTRAYTAVSGRNAMFGAPSADGWRALDLIVDAGSIERFFDGGLDAMSDIGPFGLLPVEVTISARDDARVERAEIREYAAPHIEPPATTNGGTP